MYYDPGRRHGEPQATPNEAELSRYADEGKFPFDSMEALAQPHPERETQRVMDGLLREFLKR
jgi:hypothetical protein